MQSAIAMLSMLGVNRARGKHQMLDSLCLSYCMMWIVSFVSTMAR